MQQIVDYKKEPGNGYMNSLLCFMQLFIVSNRSDTWYFSNNDERHLSFDADEKFLPLYQHADEKNKKITQLEDFADTFLPKCTLGATISRYMVLIANERKLLMMRPYQIYAVKAIVECIHENRGNGYIWHTTGSGKTLTSFKASTLLKDNDYVYKCLFVVDRKDLDRQTREEFNRFQEGCVEQNTNTEALVTRLLSTDYANKVIVTTIQKLGLAPTGRARKNTRSDLKGCGTSVWYSSSMSATARSSERTTRLSRSSSRIPSSSASPVLPFLTRMQATSSTRERKAPTDHQGHLEKQLHAYTITHAIDDGNVLRFHVEYYEPKGEGAPRPGDLVAQRKVVESILNKHDANTAGRKFNALLATASIDQAIETITSLKPSRLNASLPILGSGPSTWPACSRLLPMGTLMCDRSRKTYPRSTRTTRSSQTGRRKRSRISLPITTSATGPNMISTTSTFTIRTSRSESRTSNTRIKTTGANTRST